MEWLTQPEMWIALITLIVLELVLGVDNIIFISILAGKLPHDQQSRARTTGISLAVFTRILLLLSLRWIISLNEPFYTLPWFKIGISGHDLILVSGGLFLLWKSTHEIHQKLEGVEGESSAKVAGPVLCVYIPWLIFDIFFFICYVIIDVSTVAELVILISAVVIASGA